MFHKNSNNTAEDLRNGEAKPGLCSRTFAEENCPFACLCSKAGGQAFHMKEGRCKTKDFSKT